MISTSWYDEAAGRGDLPERAPELVRPSNNASLFLSELAAPPIRWSPDEFVYGFAGVVGVESDTGPREGDRDMWGRLYIPPFQRAIGTRWSTAGPFVYP